MKNFISFTFSLLLVACGSGGESEHGASQVIAKVNGDEISVHQLNLELSKAGGLTAEQNKVASKQALDKLVTQQLLVQKAKEAKLDRNPRMLQILEASKAQLLAKAYLESVGSAAKDATQVEIDQFYNEHPELFSDRRIFKLQEFVVAAKPEQQDAIVAKVNEATSLEEVANWLKENDYKFSANQSTKAAEQLGNKVLAAIQPLKNGGVVPVKTANTVNVVAVAAYKEAPVTKEKAKPIIERYYKNKNKTALLKKEIDNLKQNAELVYMGEFAESSTSDKKQVVETEEKMVDEPLESSNQEGDQSVLNEGLEGL